MIVDLSECFHHLNIVIHLSPIRDFSYSKIQAKIIKLINYIGSLSEPPYGILYAQGVVKEKFDILHFSSNILYVIHHNNVYAE